MNEIAFVSTVEGLELVEDCVPKPAKHFMPQWFKDIPANLNNTVRRCPSFPDFFSLGYVLPMWMDSKIQYDKENDKWDSDQSTGILPKWSIHSNDQMLDYVTPYFNGVKGNFIFKANSPWAIITPPGWSVLQLPMFYHFNQQWSAFTGVIDTDIHHEANIQILYHGNGEEFFIERGEPLVLYVPFKRNSTLDLAIRYMNSKDQKMIKKDNLNILTKFPFSGVYRKTQRKRDKNV